MAPGVQSEPCESLPSQSAHSSGGRRTADRFLVCSVAVRATENRHERKEDERKEDVGHRGGRVAFLAVTGGLPPTGP